MKKIISLMLVVLVFCAFAFTGCSDKISKDTRPEDITSTKVTEKEWREACSFIGMRDRFYELQNEVSYKIMKKVNCKIYEKVLNENKNFEFESKVLQCIAEKTISFLSLFEKRDKKAYGKEEIICFNLFPVYLCLLFSAEDCFVILNSSPF